MLAVALLAGMIVFGLAEPTAARSRPSVRGRAAAPAVAGRRRLAKTHVVTQYHGSRRTQVRFSRHHRQRHARRARAHKPAAKTRYAYPLDFFMLRAPDFDRSLLPREQSELIKTSFGRGTAEDVPARAFVRAGLAEYYPMRGGIFFRREPVKYIVVHSTETGIPLPGKRIIDSWSSMGRRHPGAQYVVDRDGSIYMAVDPDLATVHVNIFKTLPGINNDNSIGIEMVHTGRQTYPAEQRAAVIKLVSYLQDRYKVADEGVITHRYAQQGDHTDPVNFDWDAFLKEKGKFRTTAVAYRMHQLEQEKQKWQAGEGFTASTYLQIHTSVGEAAPVRAGGEAAPAPQAPAGSATPVPAFAEVRASAPQPAQLRGPIEIDPAAAAILSAPVADE